MTSHELEQANRLACVRPHTASTCRSGFEAGGGKADQRLQESRGCAAAAAGDPEPFPGFMRLPIEAVVEEINALQVVAASAPFIRIRRFRYFGLCSVAVSAGIARRVRGVARNVSVGRERLVRQQPRWLGSRTLAHGRLKADCFPSAHSQFDDNPCAGAGLDAGPLVSPGSGLLAAGHVRQIVDDQIDLVIAQRFLIEPLHFHVRPGPD